MAIHPGPQLQAAEDHLLGLSDTLPDPAGGNSLNQRWSGATVRLFHPHSRDSAIAWLTTRMDYEVQHGGICGGDWGGYGRIILGAATIATEWARRHGEADLYRAGIRWIDHAVRLCALLSVRHRGTALVVSPGCRQRVATVATRDLWSQVMLDLPRGSYGWQVDPAGAELAGLPAAEIDRRARYTRSWQGDPRPGQELWILGYRLAERVDMVSPETRALCRAWIERGEGLGDLVRGLRVHWPMVVRRYVDGAIAAWTPAVGPGILPPPDDDDSCWDAPMPAAVGYADGTVEVAQPPGIGPSAGRDLQYWSGGEPQRAGVGGGELVATIRARGGVGRPQRPVETYVRRLGLPRAALLAEVRLGRGAPVIDREPGESPTPPSPSPDPGPTPDPGTPGIPPESAPGIPAEWEAALLADLAGLVAWPEPARSEKVASHCWLSSMPPAGAPAEWVRRRRAMGRVALAVMGE